MNLDGLVYETDKQELVIYDLESDKNHHYTVASDVLPEFADLLLDIKWKRIEAGRETVNKIRRALTDRRDDLAWCNKDDDCKDGVRWLNLALDDLDWVVNPPEPTAWTCINCKEAIKDGDTHRQPDGSFPCGFVDVPH
jgi:hypothetical protein